MTEQLHFTSRETALVLIDLQRGILQMPVAPHAAADVLARSVELLAAFRKAGGTVALVRVAFAADGSDVLTQPRDSMVAPARQPGWDQLAPELGAGPTDIVITKHQWGAFYGTALARRSRHPNRSRARSFAFCASSSRFRSGAWISSE